MAMQWVRLDTAFPSNPKLLAMLGEKDGHRAALVYVCGLAWSGGHGTDGFITSEALPFIHARKADCERLVRHGFWLPQPGGWLVKDWLEFQVSSSEMEQRRRRAQAAAAARWSQRDA
jgi:hypothetical protein